MKEIPAGGRDEIAAEIHVALEKLKKDVWYEFGSEEAQSSVNIPSGWVKALSVKTPPAFNGVADDPKLKEVQERLQYLARAEVTDNGQTKTIYGKPALDFLLEGVTADIKGGKKVALGDLKVFDAFAWMLSPGEKAFQETECPAH
eukprot:1089620-Pyramimonas_sp.AAC.1